jgi:large subunit ribosomal protein L1
MTSKKETLNSDNSEAIVNDTKQINDVPQFSKAGKKSKLAVAKQEEKIKKELNKAKAAETTTIPKQRPVTRPKAERRSKNYQASLKLLEKDKLYPIKEALALIARTSTVKFDATVEAHLRLNVDPRHADQNIRDSLTLPAGSGKKLKIAVYCEDSTKLEGVEADLKYGAEFLQLLDKEQLDFDILLTTPELMPKLAKYARILGPKGLMPNIKSGTVTNDLKKAAQDTKSGKVEYRVDSNGIIHLGIGKVSFDQEALLSNFEALLSSVRNNKPNSVKSNYLKSVSLATTMGPSIKISIDNN